MTSTKRIDVKTKAAAEKAIKAGHAINIIAGRFTLLVSVNVSIWVSGNAAPRIVTWGTSAPSIETRETSAPSIVTRETSAPRIVTRETSAPRIVTRETSAPRIETRGTSAPRIETWGTSAPSIVTRETSAPRIETRGTSAPRIGGHGYSSIFVRGDGATGRATSSVVLRLQGSSKIEGGNQFIIRLETARDWCEFYGAEIDGDDAILYKAVGEGYVSYHGVAYEPGTQPSDPAWDGKGAECARGGGLNFSPTPRHTQQFVSSPTHYLQCRVKLDDMVIHWNGSYPEKVCARSVCAPLVEVDVNGDPIAEQVSA